MYVYVCMYIYIYIYIHIVSNLQVPRGALPPHGLPAGAGRHHAGARGDRRLYIYIYIYAYVYVYVYIYIYT